MTRKQDQASVGNTRSGWKQRFSKIFSKSHAAPSAKPHSLEGNRIRTYSTSISRPNGLEKVDTRTRSTDGEHDDPTRLQPENTHQSYRTRHSKAPSSSSVPHARPPPNAQTAGNVVQSNGPIPSLVECGLVVFFGDKSHKVDRDLINWNDRSWFKKYEYAAERLLMEQGHFKSKEKDAILYKKAGRCRLVRWLAAGSRSGSRVPMWSRLSGNGRALSQSW